MKRLALLVLFTIRLAAEPDYLAEGAPPPSREWNAADYAAFAGCLKKHPDDLPTYATARGAAYLKRMLALENHAFWQDPGTPLQIRIDDYQKVMGRFQEIAVLYFATKNPGTALHRELCDEMVFILQSGAQGIDLIDQVIPTIAKDESYETKMAALKNFKKGMTLMFDGAEQSLSETNVYSPEDFTNLLKAMDESLEKYNRQFGADFRKELTNRLRKRQDEFKSKPDQDCLARMLKLMAGS